MLKKRLLSVLLCLCMVVGMVPQITPTAQAYTTGDDYPSDLKAKDYWWCYNNAEKPEAWDPWYFIAKQCTSFVAHCLNSRNGVKFTNSYLGSRWGDAKNWGTNAKNLGLTVDMNPAIGAVAWWNHGTWGHVAWVKSIDGDYVWIEEYNGDNVGAFASRRIAKSDVSGYIHIKDIGGSTPSQPSVSFAPWNSQYTYVRETDASIGQIITVSNGSCTETGMYLYDASGRYVASAKNSSYTYKEVYFKINEECRYTLTPGTTYKYKFYAIVNGKTYWSSEDSFKTSGTSAPTTVYNLGSDFYAAIYYPNGGKLLTAVDSGISDYPVNVQLNYQYLASATSSNPRCIWHFVRHGDDGSYKIINEYYGYCLDVQTGVAGPERNVGAWYEDHNGKPERWFITNAWGNSSWYSLVSALEYPTYALDVYNGSSSGGANVQIYNRGESNVAQRFNINKISYSKPDRPSTPTFRGISATPERTIISWNAVPTVGIYDEREYILDIWDGTNERYAIQGKRVTGTSCEVVLPVGKYQAYVRAVNTKYADWKSDWRGLDFNVYPFRTVTMTAIPAEGGTVSPSETYSHGDFNTLVARPNEGWKVAGWTRNGQPFNGWTGNPEKWTEYGLTVTADEAFTVTFERLPEPEPPTPAYAVSVSATEGGSVSGGGTYDEGTSVTVTAEAHEGYDFKGWREGSNIVSTAASYTFNITEARNLTAVFEAKPLPKYTVNVTASPTVGGSVSGGGNNIEKGTSVTVTAVANAGYTFKYWEEAGKAVSSDASYAFTVGADRTLTAVFEQTPISVTRYTITVTSDTGGTVSGGGTYDENQQVTITATPASGYRFVEWRENGVKVSENSSYSVTASGNRTFTAVFECLPVNYTVSVTALGSGTVTGGGSYREGTAVTVTAAPASGYRFVEWRENNTKVSDSTSYSFNIDKDRSLIAVFEKAETPPVSYIVSLNATPGGTVTGSGSYEENTAVTVTAAPAEGYHFVEWQEDGEAVSNDASYQFAITGNRTLRAVFAPDAPDQAIRYSVEVSAVPAEGGTVTGEGIFDEAAEVTVTATAREGYHFLHWIADGNQVSANQQYTFTVSESLSLTAVFEKETSEPAQSFLVTVSASPEEGGTVSGGGSYQAGAFVEAAAAPNNGYRFVRWMENGSEASSNSRYTFSAAANRTLIAVFEKVGQPSAKTYSVNVSANSPAGGTVSGGGTFAENNIVTVTANANSGYHFTGWFENGSQVSTNASYTFTVSADRTLVAGFTYVGGPTNPGGNPGTNTPSSNPGDRPSGNNTGNTSTTQPSLPVITSGTDSGVTTTASPNTTIRGDTAASIITSAIAQEIIKQATTNNSGEVIIAPVVRTDVKKTEITLPATVLSEIEQKTDASLVISTPHADVSFQNSGLSTLSNGQDVVVATERTGNALKLSITVGGQPVERVPDGVVLTTSVDRSTPGTVAVLVHENGSRQVIQKSLANGSTITIPLDSSARLEIIDNAKVFTDVSVDNWAADAVAFVSGHELFSGTGSDTFSPDLPMTRGMLAVVLHNLENNPAQSGAGMFSDVASDAWYSDAVAWAAAQGIVSGYGNGLFGPGDNITREQLAVMLWRYAGEPAATNKELHFNDTSEISGYALNAVNWAVENGIINGKGDNILDPKGFATRAQVAQMLKNYLSK